MREIDVAALEHTVRDGAQLIDVRPPAEFAQGHVPGARLIPMGALASRLGDLDRRRPVYVICASGNRSSAMVSLLDASGFEAVNVTGGTGAWVRSGRPLQTAVHA